jgi:hypothetical protein
LPSWGGGYRRPQREVWGLVIVCLCRREPGSIIGWAPSRLPEHLTSTPPDLTHVLEQCSHLRAEVPGEAANTSIVTLDGCLHWPLLMIGRGGRANVDFRTLQSRAIAALVGDSEKHRFLVGTASVREQNEVSQRTGISCPSVKLTSVMHRPTQPDSFTCSTSMRRQMSSTSTGPSGEEKIDLNSSHQLPMLVLIS